ncbi:tetratricopeptide repeat protein [Campylobacter gastrosuis]|uniref:Tetratricopeptide repeat protein n=1 Tax=Campylobacter gastrosuis TaxID=2974576 RepID=A0ABT7HQ16_9BACT|nr:tetratricopeptide repeat protein [Campylobacter gastrosuis]MDL0089001.1 tetratricopeptide repeat protein [Campylobacter gastrosuis]
MANEEVVILKPPGEEKPPEELVSLDELSGANDDEGQKPEIKDEIKEPKFSKKKLIIIAGVAIFVIILIVILLLLLTKKEPKHADTADLAQQIKRSYPTKNFNASNIDEMISKANELYERGDKFEALKIYENIATQSQSLSSYNLGVSQMKQGRCDEAINSFAKAIHNKENTSVSAINAAVCSLILKNDKNFNYYIDLANSFLQNEADAPLYSYYFALINYYKGNYIEALHALNHPSSEYYRDKYDYLAGKILASLGRIDEAIARLERQREFDANFTLSQLYAIKADYAKSRDYLQKAAKNTTNPDLIKMTASIIDLKTGYFSDAAGFLGEIFRLDASLPSKFYKIKAVLNPEIFDLNLAQMHFSNDMFFNKIRRYETLFYFAPYKVFNAKQTMEQIRKGGMSVFLDDTSTANEYLKNSQNISSVNYELSNAIAKALNYRLKEANADFARLVKSYPEHSILHYNLALTYAQLGNFSLAAKHFGTSYHLDPTNYLAGAFHAISTDITNTLNPKFIAQMSENLENDPNIKTPNLYNSLLDLISENSSSLVRFLEEPKEQSMLNLAFDAIIAKTISQDELMQKKTAKLVEILPDDIVANILNFIALNDENNVKKYALAVQKYFKNRKLNEESFYHGASIIKKQYIKLLQISGLLFYERDKIIAKLKNAPANTNLLSTLAYIQIFTNEFRQSFEIYNRLIDEFKVDDAGTLFLASVAATGANEPNNAIALLELTRLSDPSAIENRIALGFLYHQINNINAAITQYVQVGNTSYKSEFYDFMIEN